MSARSSSIQLQFLTHVPDPLRTEIADRLRVIQAPKGRHLLEKGSRSTDVFFLLEGRAKVLLYSPNGREVYVNDIGPGDMFGEIAVLDGKPRSASIVASSELKYTAMRAIDFMTCLERSPAAGIWLALRWASSIRRLTEQVFELSALNVRTRIQCELLRLAEEGEPRSGDMEVRPAPTHTELSNRVGCTREAVTRELRALSGQGIIRYKRGILVIRDLDRLEREIRR